MGNILHMFALDAEVEQLEPALLPLRGVERLPVLLVLAWHLRQRDSARAALLAAEALDLLRCASLAQAERQRIQCFRQATAKVRYQNFEASRRGAGAYRTQAIAEMLSTPVAQIVAVHAGDDYVLEF